MLLDEARMKQRTLTIDARGIAQRAEWEQIRRLENLQRAVRVVRARLGLVVQRSDR